MPSKSESVPISPPSSWSRRSLDFLILTKPKINVLVGVATFAGFYLASFGDLDWSRLAFTLIGTVLLGSGASTLNQVIEKHSDAQMERTRDRPVATGRISRKEGLIFGLVLVALGALCLWFLVNRASALVGLSSAALYVLAYTPLKSRTMLSTLVGAIPGGLPTMIGWAAAGGEFNLRAWSLFSILFLWQLPHFMAIAWIHRKDYERAGTINLAVLDPEGRLCSQQAVLHSMILFPVSLTPTLLGLTGLTYLLGAAILGLTFVGFCFWFVRHRDLWHARQLFYYSIFYLPVLYLLMMIDQVS